MSNNEIKESMASINAHLKDLQTEIMALSSKMQSERFRRYNDNTVRTKYAELENVSTCAANQIALNAANDTLSAVVFQLMNVRTLVTE